MLIGRLARLVILSSLVPSGKVYNGDRRAWHSPALPIAGVDSPVTPQLGYDSSEFGGVRSVREDQAPAMRILIEHGSSQMNNMGDVAMLQVTVERLRALWPDASLAVITRSEASLARHISSAVPVVIHYPSSWTRLAKLSQSGLGRIARPLRLRMEARLSRLLPARYKQNLLGAVESADLVVHAGSGVIADPFLPAALRRLDLLRRAVLQGRPTALFSQGMGPIQNPLLRDAVSSTLAKVGLITARDRGTAILLTELLERKAGQYPVTGDDALELAYRTRSETLGTGLGLNMRFAPYSGLSEGDLPLLESLLESVLPALGRTEGEVVPLAVHPNDTNATSAWMEAAGLTPDAPHHEGTVPGLLGAISRCRLVITGSYHGAVLALGQGIPAICLYRSAYYQRKFAGLADLFPGGCELIDLESKQAEQTLGEAAGRLLEEGQSLRPRLWERTREQILASKEAYARFGELVKA